MWGGARRGAAVAACLVLGSCGGDDGGGASGLPTFNSASAVADALSRAGMACDAFELSKDTGIAVGLPDAKEVGLCRTYEDQFEWGVSVLSAANEVNAILLGRDAMCSAVNPDPSSGAQTDIVIAYGGNWILSPLPLTPTHTRAHWAEASRITTACPASPLFNPRVLDNGPERRRLPRGELTAMQLVRHRLRFAREDYTHFGRTQRALPNRERGPSACSVLGETGRAS
jgi:hypothetical protein